MSWLVTRRQFYRLRSTCKVKASDCSPRWRRVPEYSSMGHRSLTWWWMATLMTDAKGLLDIMGGIILADPSSGIHSERPFSRDGHRRVGERSTGKLHSALVSAPVVLEGRVFGNRRIDEVELKGLERRRPIENEYGQCGVGNFREVIQEVTPVCIGPSEELVASRLATGAFHSLCVNLDGQVLVWGHADYLGVDRAAIKARCGSRLDAFDTTTAYAAGCIAARGRTSYALLTRKEEAVSLSTSSRKEFKWGGLVTELSGAVTTDVLSLAVCLRRHGRLLCREEVGLDIGSCQVGEADMSGTYFPTGAYFNHRPVLLRRALHFVDPPTYLYFADQHDGQAWVITTTAPGSAPGQCDVSLVVSSTPLSSPLGLCVRGGTALQGSAVGGVGLALGGQSVYLRRDDSAIHGFDGRYVRSDSLTLPEGLVVYTHTERSNTTLRPSVEQGRWELHRGSRLLAYSNDVFNSAAPWSVVAGIGLWYTPTGDVLRLEVIALPGSVASCHHDDDHATVESTDGISVEVERVVRSYRGRSSCVSSRAIPRSLAWQLAAHFGLAVDRTGVVYGWGDSTYGELPSSKPAVAVQDGSVRKIEALEGFKGRQVACGDRHALVVTEGGSILAFGDNRAGQCGVSGGKAEGSSTKRPKLLSLDAGKASVVVACGARHSALVTSEGHLYTWGHSGDGKLIHVADNYGPGSVMAEEMVGEWDGEEVEEEGTKENRRPPGVAISSRLKASVAQPRMVYSLSHLKVHAVGLGQDSTIVVIGGSSAMNDDSSSCPDSGSPQQQGRPSSRFRAFASSTSPVEVGSPPSAPTQEEGNQLEVRFECRDLLQRPRIFLVRMGIHGRGGRPTPLVDLTVEGVGSMRVSLKPLDLGKAARAPRRGGPRGGPVNEATVEDSGQKLAMADCPSGDPSSGVALAWGSSGNFSGAATAAGSHSLDGGIDAFLEEVHELRRMNEDLLRQYDKRYQDHQAAPSPVQQPASSQQDVGASDSLGFPAPFEGRSCTSTNPGSATLDASPRTWASDFPAVELDRGDGQERSCLGWRSPRPQRTPRLEASSPRLKDGHVDVRGSPREDSTIQVVRVRKKREERRPALDDAGGDLQRYDLPASSSSAPDFPAELLLVWGPELAYMQQWAAREYGSIEAAVSSLDRHTHDPEKGVLFFELWRWCCILESKAEGPSLMSRILLGAGAKHKKEVGVNTDVHRSAAAGRGAARRGHSLLLREGKKDSIGGGIRNRAMRGIALEKRPSTGKLVTPPIMLPEELQDGLEAVSERHASTTSPSTHHVYSYLKCVGVFFVYPPSRPALVFSMSTAVSALSAAVPPWLLPSWPPTWPTFLTWPSGLAPLSSYLPSLPRIHLPRVLVDARRSTLLGFGCVGVLCGSALWYLRKRRQAFWRNASMFVQRSDMSRDEIERGCRMMALPQLSKRPLHKKSFLVVGCGGLANTCATYIAACLLPGCRITLIDGDVVEASNLQRQHQLYTMRDVGRKKSDSARAACRRVAMKGVSVEVAPGMLTKTNARDLVGKHDIILDCTDCPATRWLLSSACATARRPLVSGAAMQWSGQVTVYCSGEAGPCMRCVFPEPSPSEGGRGRGGCDTLGVFPPLPGMIGCVMASEALKLALMDGPQLEEASLSGRLLLVDMLDGGLSTRTVVLKRRPDCPVCGWTEESAAAQDRSDASSLHDDTDAVQLPAVNSIGPKQLRHLMLESPSAACLVIDVRPKPQFDMVHLRGSVNVPYEDSQAFVDKVKALLEDRRPNTAVVCCRKGNDSRLAVCALQTSFKYLLNLDGGIMQAAKELGVAGKHLFIP
ncbi:Urmylation protein [Perkinsus olseni]|uniref:Urmylation protein n=1 Tax=Perkinsus olseni TaxID=32597 RepID=A0A7J6PFA6_PEROL|nr:Urmylation protein [Perkinsus olseni]